jgi:hypothetical protein
MGEYSDLAVEGISEAEAEAADPGLRRVLRTSAAPGLLAALAARLAPTDLQLAVFRRPA